MNVVRGNPLAQWKEFVQQVERELGIKLFIGFAHHSEQDELRLTPSEETSLGGRASGRRRLDFLIGRAAARRAMEAAGYPDGEVLVGESGAPSWPRGLVGSISHSAGHAVAVVADRSTSSGVGVDLEHRRAVDEIESLVAFGSELDWLSAQTKAAKNDLLLELFAAKESLYKAVFPVYGRFFGFEAARLVRPTGSTGFDAHFEEPMEGFEHGGPIRASLAWRGDMVLALVVLST